MGWRADCAKSCRGFYPQAADGFIELGSAVTLGFCVGWNAFIRRGSKCLYPNLAGFLIGVSSITMKSSVIDFYREIINHAAKDNAIRNPAGTESFERSLSRLREKVDTGHWYHPEFGTVFATMSKEFGHGIADDLTLLLDGDSIDKEYTDKKKDVHVEPMRVSMLIGATPAVCMDYLEPIHASQGFLQRPAVVFGVPNPSIPLPTSTQAMRTDYECLKAEYLNAFLLFSQTKPQTEHTLHPDAKTLLDLFEIDLEDRVTRGELDGASAKRGIVTVLKIAMINEYDDYQMILPSPNVIEFDGMDAAIEETKRYIDGAQELRGILSDRPDFAKAKYFIRKCGKTTEKKIMRSCHIEADRMRIIKMSLRKMGFVDCVNDTYEWVG